MNARRDWETTLVRLFFWVCWTGVGFTWLVILFGWKFGVTFNNLGSVLMVNAFVGLWCATVLCIRRVPKLALLGWIMLSPWIIWMAYGLVAGLLFHLLR